MTESKTGRSRFARWAIIVLVTLAVSLLSILWQRGSRQAESPPPTLPPSAGSDRPAGAATPLPDVGQVLEEFPGNTPPSGPARPARLEVERLGIDTPVFTVGLEEGYIVTPSQGAGYWYQSAPLTEAGNTVIVGHSDAEPVPVFLHLSQVEVGDTITLTDQFGLEYRYEVTETEVIQVEDAPSEEAGRTLEAVQPSESARLTLLTCYPDSSCPARFVAVAAPVNG